MKTKANEIQVGGSHYKDLAVEPWEALEAWLSPEEFRGYMLGNALVYLARAGKKGAFLTDIKKAHHTLAKLIEFEEQQNENLLS